MGYFKVYANCCKSATPIKEIAKSELPDQIEVLINQAADEMLLQDVHEIIWGHEQALKHLEEHEILNCGDFCIVKQDDVPQERPNMCGFDTFIFEN